MTDIAITCKITGKSYKYLRGFLNNLRAMGISSREYYDKYLKVENEEICKCGQLKGFNNFTHGYNEYCSSKCPFVVDNRLNAIRNRFKGPDRDTKIEAFKQRRGTVDINIEKRRETLKLKAESMGMTPFEYYSMMGSKSFKSRSRESIIESTERAMITKQKNNTLVNIPFYKDYTIFDRVVKVQGYEPLVLDYLQSFLTEADVTVDCKKIGSISYFNKLDEKKLYFPDFLLKDFIVEVKSLHTFSMNREMVFAKIGGVFNLNRSVLLVIPTISEVRKNKLDGSKKLLDWAISSQASKDHPFVAIYDEGSTTILKGVESNDSKCRGPSRCLEECDIVWSPVKVGAVEHDRI